MPFLIIEANEQEQMLMDLLVIDWMAADLQKSGIDLFLEHECMQVLVGMRYPTGAVQRLVRIAAATAARQRGGA